MASFVMSTGWVGETFVSPGWTVKNGVRPIRRSWTHMSAVPRNANLSKLQAGYLFPEIGRRRKAYLADHPEAKIISLGVGDTTQPIPGHIVEGLRFGANKLGTQEGYTGYGDGNGELELREKIADRLYNGNVSADEVFVSDGAKCDIGRIQVMFGSDVTVAVQDPSYPVYVDTSVMHGQTGLWNAERQQFDGIVYMKCDPSTNFFPELESLPRTDVIFFCSPNNPTGAAATRDQLQELVNFATKNGSIIVYDAAYAPFIRSSEVPKSIFEIPGARKVAMECNSFSKYAGFTGVRLGWVVCPSELTYADGTPVKNDFSRIMATCFNGASNIAQFGGMACLDDTGLSEIEKLMDYYLGNAKRLRDTMVSLGFTVHGGQDAPYIWVEFPGRKSWDVFSEILEKTQIVTIPGAGFGPGGEGFLRLSAFAPREACEEACERMRKFYGS
mmetsp:Transcript_17321/g.35976  ORF Transcript_17321/g.35976 Transcript_17321/m.35976 type:complete len:443 (-) Transcript_17321:911-2239(-)|eukprot:CAMPEP_0184682512 /NCGR_PEP_ID=MMETSP0312-20130426/7521_1 /TAXON_ID=31354 /ORGANISM="Compsopogon coeruleus, Strain SAG 36.94" /LENGTH=442 /DNA_ID=CAMNT_0027134217 /DNA_START=83 /DNA_END=1411 /DNA_ORIENTATION=+